MTLSTYSNTNKSGMLTMPRKHERVSINYQEVMATVLRGIDG